MFQMKFIKLMSVQECYIQIHVTNHTILKKYGFGSLVASFISSTKSSIIMNVHLQENT